MQGNGDYISREAALSEQNKSMNLAEMRERLKRIPAADVRPRWIPVTERLPEDFQKVLVFWQEHSEPVIDTAFWMEESKSFNCSHWERAGEKVTHWMPLPEPPKEE